MHQFLLPVLLACKTIQSHKLQGCLFVRSCFFGTALWRAKIFQTTETLWKPGFHHFLYILHKADVFSVSYPRYIIHEVVFETNLVCSVMPLQQFSSGCLSKRMNGCKSLFLDLKVFHFFEDLVFSQLAFSNYRSDASLHSVWKAVFFSEFFLLQTQRQR